MPFGDEILGPEDMAQQPDDFFNREYPFDNQFGNDVQTSYRPSTSIDDDSDFGHLLDL